MLYAGTSGYAYKPWKGKFYPKDLPDRQMLPYYGEHFRAVEINNTFYGLPAAAAVRGWAAEVGGEFRFALKVPQQITHRQRLRDADEAVARFFEVARVLGKRLGPVLFQLPPNFPKDLARLRAFLKLLSRRRRRVAFEFRHASWFDDEVFAVLRDRRVALCVADDENDLEVPFVATTDWGYLRLRRPDYTEAELAAWVKRVRKPGWQDAFVFFKHEDRANGPRLARRFLDLAGGP